MCGTAFPPNYKLNWNNFEIAGVFLFWESSDTLSECDDNLNTTYYTERVQVHIVYLACALKQRECAELFSRKRKAQREDRWILWDMFETRHFQRQLWETVQR